MNKQEFVALLNTQLKGKPFESYGFDFIITDILNTALGNLQKSTPIRGDRHNRSEVFLKFDGNIIMTVTTHKKKSTQHYGFGNWGGGYCDWVFGPFTEADVTILGDDTMTIEEAMVLAADHTAHKKKAFEDELALAREAMDLLIARYNFKDDCKVLVLCDFILDNRIALQKRKSTDNN